MFENGCYIRRQKRFRVPGSKYSGPRKSGSSSSSKLRNNNNNNSNSETGNVLPGGDLTGMGHVTTKKEIIDDVGAGHHDSAMSQHMTGSNYLSAISGLYGGGQQNHLADSYLQNGKNLSKSGLKSSFEDIPNLGITLVVFSISIIKWC